MRKLEGWKAVVSVPSQRKAWEGYLLEVYYPDDPTRLCRPKAGQSPGQINWSQLSDQSHPFVCFIRFRSSLVFMPLCAFFFLPLAICQIQFCLVVGKKEVRNVEGGKLLLSNLF